MVSALIIYFALITLGFAAVIEKFGFQVYPSDRAGGQATSADDVNMTLWWDHEIIQCAVQPSQFETWYYCYPDHDSTDYCWDSSTTHAHNLLFTMDSADSVWIGAVYVLLTDASWANARHFCLTATGDDRISIPGATLMSDTYCSYWSSLRIYEHMCVGAGSDCNNDYVMLNLIDPSINAYEGRINGRNGRDLAAPVLSEDYQCSNTCDDGLFCNGDEYWDAVDAECKDGVNVTCPVHSYCDNSATNCLRNCDSFAIDEYLTDCSLEFDGNVVQIENLKLGFDGLAERVDQHDVFEQHIWNITADVNALSERVANNDVDIADVNASVTSELGDIRSLISELKSNISVLNTRFASIETEMSAITDEIDFLKTQITDFGPFESARNDRPLIDNPSSYFDPSAYGDYYVIIILVMVVMNILSNVIGCYVCLAVNKKRHFKFAELNQIDE